MTLFPAHLTVFVSGRIQSGSSDEEGLHHKTGTVLSLHLLLHEDSWIRSSRIRHAEVFQSIATLGAPDGAYLGSQWIHRAGSGTGPVDSPVDFSGDTARFGIGISAGSEVLSRRKKSVRTRDSS